MGPSSTGSITPDTLANVTLAGNSAPNAAAGGIYLGGSKLDSKNSIVALNTAGSANECYGVSQSGHSPAFTSLGYNLTDTPDTCGFSATGDKVVSASSVKLGPLANNGGPTRTRALQPGSPGINAGNPAGCTTPTGALLSTDQRGFPRPVGGRCDIGAFELQPLVVCTLKAKSSKVLVKKPKGKKGKKAKVGVLTLSASCNQAATLTLTGKLTERKNKHHRKNFKLRPHTYTIAAGQTLTITLKLPKAAVTALAHHKRESLKLTLTANNLNGIAVKTLKLGRLRAKRR